jgi:hypothetical protein
VTSELADAASCPKCGAARTSAAACPKCGLIADRWAAFAAQQTSSVSPAVQAAWQRTVDDWADRARHDAMFELASRTGELAWTAARYREQQRARTGDATASAQLERIRRAAEATLTVSKTIAAERGTPYKSVLAFLLIVVIAAIAGLVYVRVMHGNKSVHVAPTDDTTNAGTTTITPAAGHTTNAAPNRPEPTPLR